MSRAGLVHVMQVSVLTDEHGEHVPDIEWFHPEGCAVTVSSEPDPYRGLTVHYDGPVSYNLEAAGLDAFRDGPPKEPGLYLVEAWSEVLHYPEGQEYDGGLAVVEPDVLSALRTTKEGEHGT